MKSSEKKFYFKSQKKSICYGVFLLLMLGGVILGTVLVSTADNLNFYRRLLFTHNIFKTKPDVSFVMQFFRSFLAVLMLLVLQFFSGYFAFGQVITMLSMVYRGVVSGISVAFIYIMLGVKGFFVVLVTAVPFAVLTAAVLILGARESIKQSGKIADYSFFGAKREADVPETKLYLLKFSLLAVFLLILSLADTIVIYFLGDVFF